MKYEKFKYRTISITYYDRYNQDVWNEIKQIKNETANIDFGCTFDNNGYCNTTRTFWTEKMDQKCCCKLCAEYIGYLKFINSEKDLKYYAKLFNNKTGFWRKDKGCILDRSMRSSTCVTYTCFDMLIPKMNKINRKLNKLYQQTTNV